MNSLILFIDFFFGIFCLSIGSKYLLLLIALIVLLATTLITEFREIDRRLTFAIHCIVHHHRQRRQQESLLLLPQLLLQQLERFRLEHSQILIYLKPFNEQVVSPFYFAYVLGNVVFNAYCIVYVVYFQVQPLMRNFSIAVLFFQILVPLACSLILLVLNLSVRQSLRTVESTLFKLSFFDKRQKKRRRSYQNCLRSYWKSLIYVEFLKPKHLIFYSMTAGPIGPINSQSLVQVRAETCFKFFIKCLKITLFYLI